MESAADQNPVPYFAPGRVRVPGVARTLASRLAFPLLSVLSREQSLRLGLTPIDDERVLIALRHARGRALDVGCGANNFIRSYGNGVGVDVVAWEGCDRVVQDTADLPFADRSFQTVSFLACLNHIPNRADALREAHRVLAPGGRLIVTMITPRLGRLIHLWRRPHDPDERERHIDHEHELLGIDPQALVRLIEQAGFVAVRRRRFVYGLNNLFLAERAAA